jgi:predicted TIM-barrel fold metal-dependent hydrolase
MATTASDTVLITSSDAHVSPPLADMRPYCEKKLLDEFDAYVRDFESQLGAPPDLSRPAAAAAAARRQNKEDLDRLQAEQEIVLTFTRRDHTLTAGGHGDMGVRIAEGLDREGVAAEVVFHGTQGDTRDGRHINWPIPWSISDRSLLAGPDSQSSAELATAGRQIYNRWLADFCSNQPERHAGLAHIPIWDIDAAVEEVRWAKANGLRGVNFPAPGASFGGLTVDSLNSTYPPYESDYWDPLFATCAELGMTLTTHVGHPILPPIYQGPGSFGIILCEQMALGGRNIWHLIFSGAFDRHPNLTLAVTEVLGTWFVQVVDFMESVYQNKGAGPGDASRYALKRSPLEYVKSNVYFGSSFMSRPEALAAVEHDLVDRIMWGHDYPHFEATWHPDGSAPPITPISLANTFHGFKEEDVRAMAGTNLIRCYGLDERALEKVARKIGPSIDDLLDEPDLSLVPDDYVGLGFRDAGGPFT